MDTAKTRIRKAGGALFHDIILLLAGAGIVLLIAGLFLTGELILTVFQH